MRIIAGQFRSRLLQSPRGDATRPTSDRLRESLFSILGPRIEGARFADLFAGSGAVGLEALSRGADFVWFAEKAPPASAAIRANLTALKIGKGYALEDRGTARLLKSMAERGHAADIVFLDPPYDAADLYETTLTTLARDHALLLADNALIIAEHARRTPLADRYTTLYRTRVLEQGDAALSFYEAVMSG